MRIAVIGPTYPFKGGIAHHTTLLVQELRRRDHNVLFISYSRQYPELLYGRSDKDPSSSRLETEASYLIDSINPITWLKAARAIIDYDATQLILPWWVPFWAPFYLTLTAWPYVRRPSLQTTFVCHNILPHESGIVKRWLSQITLRQGNRFLVQSASEAEKLRSIHPKACYAVVPLPTFAPLLALRDGGGDGVSQADLREPLRFEDKPYKALFCGIVRHYKGLDILLEAVRLMQAEQALIDGFQLVVAGEFWDGVDQYRIYIEKHRLNHLIEIEDRYLPNERLAAYLEKADVVILPYRSATQSAVVQTALGAGTPVIGTAVGGVAEEIRHGINGLLVPPENPLALAKAMIRYFKEDLKAQLKIARRPNDRHSWAYFVEQLTILMESE